MREIPEATFWCWLEIKFYFLGCSHRICCYLFESILLQSFHFFFLILSVGPQDIKKKKSFLKEQRKHLKILCKKKSGSLCPLVLPKGNLLQSLLVTPCGGWVGEPWPKLCPEKFQGPESSPGLEGSQGPPGGPPCPGDRSCGLPRPAAPRWSELHRWILGRETAPEK